MALYKWYNALLSLSFISGREWSVSPTSSHPASGNSHWTCQRARISNIFRSLYMKTSTYWDFPKCITCLDTLEYPSRHLNTFESMTLRAWFKPNGVSRKTPIDAVGLWLKCLYGSHPCSFHISCSPYLFLAAERNNSSSSLCASKDLHMIRPSKRQNRSLGSCIKGLAELHAALEPYTELPEGIYYYYYYLFVFQ